MAKKRKVEIINPQRISTDMPSDTDYKALESDKFNKKYVDKSLEHINRGVNLAIQYENVSPDEVHRLYLKLLAQYNNSFQRAFIQDGNLAVQSLLNGYFKLISLLKEDQRDITLASFYIMALENPNKKASVLSQAAQYTVGTAFVILYSSYLKYGSIISDRPFRLKNEKPATPREYAYEILVKNMDDIYKLNVVALEKEGD